jgi:ATP-binding cassette subfamily B (MDR/TAP) protein 1
VLSKYIFVLSEYGNEPLSKVEADRNKWTWVFVALCLGIGIMAYLQKLFFGRGGENLTFSLRVALFEAFLHKQIGWFDNKNRAPGILTNIITEDISAVNGLTTESLAIAVEAGLGLFFSCLICFIFSWELGFVVTFTSPFMVLGGLGMSKLQFNQKAVDDSYKQANALLNDLIMNYRTVIAFGQKNVDSMLDRYNKLLVIPHQTNIKRAHISGLFFGYSQAIRFVFIGFVFFVAALFVQKFQYDQEQTQKTFTGCYVVFVGAIGSGVSISQMPSISKARQAAKTVFGIIEEKSKIDPKQKGTVNQLTGCVEFRNMYFRYPSR